MNFQNVKQRDTRTVLYHGAYSTANQKKIIRKNPFNLMLSNIVDRLVNSVHINIYLSIYNQALKYVLLTCILKCGDA